MSIFRRIILYIASYFTMPSKGIRLLFLKWVGLNILDWRHTHIGYSGVFNTIFPEKISIDGDVVIPNDYIILSHFFNANTRKFFLLEKVHLLGEEA